MRGWPPAARDHHLIVQEVDEVALLKPLLHRLLVDSLGPLCRCCNFQIEMQVGNRRRSPRQMQVWKTA